MAARSQLLSAVAARIAKRARTNPLLVAWALARYRRAHRLNEGALAVQLGVSRSQLASLALCHRPEPGLPHFRAAVRDLALASGCDATLLAEVLLEAGPGPAKRPGVP